jgi:hypothetical protein
MRQPERQHVGRIFDKNSFPDCKQPVEIARHPRLERIHMHALARCRLLGH